MYVNIDEFNEALIFYVACFAHLQWD